jgi:hypothetical protein
MKETEKLTQKIADVTAKIETLKAERQKALEAAAESLETKGLSRIAGEQIELENILAVLENRYAEAVSSEAATDRETKARKAEKEAGRHIVAATGKFRDAAKAIGAYLAALKDLEAIREEYKTVTADCGIDYYHDETNHFLSTREIQRGFLGTGEAEGLVGKIERLLAYSETADLPGHTYQNALSGLEELAGISR